MRSPSSTERSSSGRRLKIASVTPSQQRKRIHDAIAQRAFHISESRRCEPEHQLEDWQRAESEILRPLNCGFLMLDDKIGLSTDATCFEEGEIEIYVEPRRLTICGKERVCKPGATPEKGVSRLKSNLVFHFLDLPLEIKPSQVTARFKGRTLEIDLPKASAIRKVHTHENAA